MVFLVSVIVVVSIASVVGVGEGVSVFGICVVMLLVKALVLELLVLL